MTTYHKKEGDDEKRHLYCGEVEEAVPSRIPFWAQVAMVVTACFGVIGVATYGALTSAPPRPAPAVRETRRVDETPVRSLDDLKENHTTGVEHTAEQDDTTITQTSPAYK